MKCEIVGRCVTMVLLATYNQCSKWWINDVQFNRMKADMDMTGDNVFAHTHATRQSGPRRFGTINVNRENGRGCESHRHLFLRQRACVLFKRAFS